MKGVTIAKATSPLTSRTNITNQSTDCNNCCLSFMKQKCHILYICGDGSTPEDDYMPVKTKAMKHGHGKISAVTASDTGTRTGHAIYHVPLI